MQSIIISTVDVVLLTILDGALNVGLLTRQNQDEPFCGVMALPGGYIRSEVDDNAKEAAARVLHQKTGLENQFLEEYGSASGPLRDPRGWSLSVIFYALASPDALISENIKMIPVSKIPSLAFDHKEIIKKVVDRVRSKSGYSSLLMHLCPEEFTIPELQNVYEIVRGESIPGFRRKLLELDALEPVKGAMKSTGKSRPANLFRLKAKYKESLAVRDRGL